MLFLCVLPILSVCKCSKMMKLQDCELTEMLGCMNLVDVMAFVECEGCLPSL